MPPTVVLKLSRTASRIVEMPIDGSSKTILKNGADDNLTKRRVDDLAKCWCDDCLKRWDDDYLANRWCNNCLAKCWYDDHQNASATTAKKLMRWQPKCYAMTAKTLMQRLPDEMELISKCFRPNFNQGFRTIWQELLPNFDQGFRTISVKTSAQFWWSVKESTSWRQNLHQAESDSCRAPTQ